VETAQLALQAFWATPGDLGADQAAEACRKLEPAQLRLIAAWIPAGQGRTAEKCARAARIVMGILAEKGA